VFVLYELRVCHKTFKRIKLIYQEIHYFTTYLSSGGGETKENYLRGCGGKKVKNHCAKGFVEECGLISRVSKKTLKKLLAV